MGLRAVALGVCAAALMAAACGDGGDGATEPSLKCPSKEPPEPLADLSSLSLDGVYERMAESITCPGYVLKAVTRQESEIVYPEAGMLSYTIESSKWIDLPTGRAREEMRYEYSVPWEEEEGTEGNAVSIVLGDDVYWGGSTEGPGRGSEAPVCHGSQSAVLSLLLGCRANTEDQDLQSRFEPLSEYQGRPMPALVTEGTVSAEIGATAFTEYLYLDDQMLLPVLQVVEGTQNKGNPAESPVNGEGANEYDFVSVDSLPEDFFDPEAIGYVEPYPQEVLRGADIGFMVYWLGLDFAGTGNLPGLKLRQVYVPGPENGRPSYPVVIEYSLANKKFGSRVVALSLFPRSAWDAARPGGGFWDDACAQETEVDLGDRRAVVVGGYGFRSSGGACPDQPPDWWGANIYTDGTVIHVTTSDRGKFLREYVPTGSRKTSKEWVQNPYSSREGMEAIVRGLVARPSDE